MSRATTFSQIRSYLTPGQRDRFQSSTGTAERKRLIETGRLKRYAAACLTVGPIFEASSNAMLVVDKTGEIVLVNGRAEELFQYDRDELIGNNVSMLVPGRHAESRSQITELMRNPRYMPLGTGDDLCGVRKDGREMPLQISLSPMKVSDGDVLTAAIIVDVTQCRRAERMCRVTVEASTTAIVMVDAAMRIMLVNTKTETLFQFTRAELIGNHFSMVIPERYRTQVARLLEDLTAADMGKARPERPLHGLKKDGTEVAVVIGLNRINVCGESDGLVLISITDITETIKMENLIKSSQIAQEASRLKSIFLANVSHEIRTPLSGITTTVDLLASTDMSDEQAFYVGMLRDASRTLIGIVNNVLDFSKIEAGKVDVEFVQFDLRDVVQRQYSLFSRRAADRGIAFHVSCPTAPIVVKSDEVKFRQILLNILDNAVKFTGDKGSITLRLDIVDPVSGVQALIPPNNGTPGQQSANVVTIRLSVADTGIGMSQDAMNDLFSDFYQADQSTTRRFGGTGLGLAICQKLVHMLGGTIAVQSELGKGTTFVVTLAFLRASDRHVSSGSSTSLEGGVDNGGRMQARPVDDMWQRAAAALRILIVEDNRVNRTILQRVVEKLGHSVDIANDGMQAVALLERPIHFDVVLMDCHMPVMDGYEATRVIRAIPHRKTIPIIALTASAVKGDRERCLDAGMNEYLTKPIRIDKLKQVLNDVTAALDPGRATTDWQRPPDDAYTAG